MIVLAVVSVDNCRFDNKQIRPLVAKIHTSLLRVERARRFHFRIRATMISPWPNHYKMSLLLSVRPMENYILFHKANIKK